MLINWGKFNKRNPEHVKRVVAKVQEFMGAPAALAERVQAKVKEMTGSSDTSDWASATNAIEAYQTDVGELDVGWAAAFAEVDLRGSSKNSIDILGVSSGLTFAQVREGGRAKIYGVSGAKTTVGVSLYGGGVGFLKTWWDDQEWYKIEELARDFRWKQADQQATLMYGLITSGHGETTAYDTNDQTTLGAACADLIVDNETALPGITDSTTFLLFHHPTLKQRVAKALRSVLAYQPGQTELVYNIRSVSSPKISSSYLGWLVAPGLKNKFVRKMDLTLLSDEDITMFAEDVVGWVRYGGYANSDQINRVAAS